MYLHIDDARPEPQTYEGAITRREAVILSITAHVVLILLMLWLPTLPWIQELANAAVIEPQPVVVAEDRDSLHPFVMVEPRIDREALRAIERPAPLSDLDREARTRERPPDARNSQPFSRGTTPEFVEAAPRSARARGEGPAPEPAPPQPQGREGGGTPAAGQQPAEVQPERPAFQGQNAGTSGRSAPPPGGALGEALRNLSRYTQDQAFENPTGGQGELAPWIQFDSKGVEFGPWLRRFVAQVKRNWFVPYAAMSLRGHVVITFNVHKDGRITDLQVVQPSSVEAFNNAALNALMSSNPTMPLPPEYPADKAFFTVTFFYNETPPVR